MLTLQLVTCDSPAGKLGVTVCYDLRFPEMYQLLAWHMGAQIMLVPSAFTVATGAPTRMHMHRCMHAHPHASIHTHDRIASCLVPKFSSKYFSLLHVFLFLDTCALLNCQVSWPL